VNKTVNHFMLSLIDIEWSNDRAVSKQNWHFGTLYLLIIVSLWAYFAITLLELYDTMCSNR
jgi:hypothetical protein